jgi:hypothetical protein
MHFMALMRTPKMSGQLLLLNSKEHLGEVVLKSHTCVGAAVGAALGAAVGAAVGAGVGAGVGVMQNFFAPASQLQPTELQVDPGVPALGQEPLGNVWPVGQIELSHCPEPKHFDISQ